MQTDPNTQYIAIRATIRSEHARIASFRSPYAWALAVATSAASRLHHRSCRMVLAAGYEAAFAIYTSANGSVANAGTHDVNPTPAGAPHDGYDRRFPAAVRPALRAAVHGPRLVNFFRDARRNHLENRVLAALHFVFITGFASHRTRRARKRRDELERFQTLTRHSDARAQEQFATVL